MSLTDKDEFGDVVDAWDRKTPGMPVDVGHFLWLRKTIGSMTSFKGALREDMSTAIEDEACLKCTPPPPPGCTLAEEGEQFQAIFRFALELALQRMRAAQREKLRSCGSRPAPLEIARESPIDGDAFRLCDQTFISEQGNDDCLILEMHCFSDATRGSRSGGK